jgi:hypothetical protein
MGRSVGAVTSRLIGSFRNMGSIYQILDRFTSHGCQSPAILASEGEAPKTCEKWVLSPIWNCAQWPE